VAVGQLGIEHLQAEVQHGPGFWPGSLKRVFETTTGAAKVEASAGLVACWTRYWCRRPSHFHSSSAMPATLLW
jgi:hypothetical protein